MVMEVLRKHIEQRDIYYLDGGWRKVENECFPFRDVRRVENMPIKRNAVQGVYFLDQ